MDRREDETLAIQAAIRACHSAGLDTYPQIHLAMLEAAEVMVEPKRFADTGRFIEGIDGTPLDPEENDRIRDVRQTLSKRNGP